jgi:hypothetical protein
MAAWYLANNKQALTWFAPASPPGLFFSTCWEDPQVTDRQRARASDIFRSVPSLRSAAQTAEGNPEYLVQTLIFSVTGRSIKMQTH